MKGLLVQLAAWLVLFAAVFGLPCLALLFCLLPMAEAHAVPDSTKFYILALSVVLIVSAIRAVRFLRIGEKH